MNNKPINPSPELVATVTRAIFETDKSSNGEASFKQLALAAIQAMPDACAIVDRLVRQLQHNNAFLRNCGIVDDNRPLTLLEINANALAAAAEFKKQWGGHE